MTKLKKWFMSLDKECRMTALIALIIFIILIINICVDLVHLNAYINHKHINDNKIVQIEKRVRDLELNVDYLQNALETR